MPWSHSTRTAYCPQCCNSLLEAAVHDAVVRESGKGTNANEWLFICTRCGHEHPIKQDTFHRPDKNEQ